MVFCDQKLCFLSYNPWGRGNDNGRKPKVLVGKFKMHKIGNRLISQSVR